MCEFVNICAMRIASVGCRLHNYHLSFCKYIYIVLYNNYRLHIRVSIIYVETVCIRMYCTLNEQTEGLINSTIENLITIYHIIIPLSSLTTSQCQAVSHKRDKPIVKFH